MRPARRLALALWLIAGAAPGCLGPAMPDDPAPALAAARTAFATAAFETAVREAATAAERAAAIGDAGTEVAALNLQGQAERRLARYDQAMAAHAAAETLARRWNDRGGLAAALRGQGDVQERRKDHLRAVVLYESSLAALRLPEDWTQAVDTLLQLGDIHVVGGRFDQAYDTYGRALTLAEAAGDAEATARARDYLGYAKRRAGDDGGAAALHRAALEGGGAIADPLTRERARARALNHLGLALQGSFRSALEAGDRGAAEAVIAEAILSERAALEAARAAGDGTREGYVLRALAQLHLEAAELAPGTPDRAHLERAQAVAAEAVARGAAIRLPEWEGLALHQLARAEAALGRRDAAAAALDAAGAIWTRIGDRYAAGHEALLRARALHEPAGRLEEALAAYAAADAAFAPLGAVAELAEIARARALLLQRLGRLDEAERALDRALAITEDAYGAAHRETARTLSRLARLQLDRDRPDLGLPLARRATAINRGRLGGGGGGQAAGPGARDSLETGFRIHVALAHAAARDAAAADGLAAEAFEVAQLAHGAEVGRALGRMAARFAAGADALAAVVRAREERLEQRRRLERRLLDSLAEPPAGRDDAREAALRREIAEADAAVAALDGRLAAEFPAYAELSNPRPLALAAVQALLAPDEALLLFSVGETGVHLWTVRPATAGFDRLAIDAARLAGEVRGLRARLEPLDNPMLAPFEAARAHRLYQALLGPALPRLDGARHLLVVPDGALQSLPLGVLVTAAPQPDAPVAWLARQVAISTLPTVSALKALRGLAGATRAPSAFLGIGDPALDGSPDRTRGRQTRVLRGGSVDVAAVRQLPALPETADELRRLARSQGAGERDLMLRERAQEPLLRAARLADYRVIAFATHGLLAGDLAGLSEPALVLTPPARPTPDNDGLLTASKIAQMALNADWVILSACNTAADDGTPGAEGLSGLAKAFFHAGSRALLVSHWPVLSHAAVRLTTGSFEALRRAPGIGRAEALRRSILALLDDPTLPPEFRHPLVWAPFVVVGEGGAGR